MVGTGVFTSLGFQVMGIKSVSAILVLWLVGGLVALSGALTYAELAVRYPRSGGEYNFLSSIYHPALGFLSGWISSTVGFAAPMAISCMAFGSYFSKIFPELAPIQLALSLLAVLTILNLLSFKAGSGFQSFFTILNICLITCICLASFFFSSPTHFKLSFNSNDISNIFNPSFAVSLVYVSLAYSGWNSATYVAGEIKKPKENLPKALFRGTLIVILLYLALNFVFLYAVPIENLAGVVEVGYLAASTLFGQTGGIIISLIICIGLIASVNSLMIAGPRVIQTIGEDFSFFNIFTTKNKNGSPIYAILFQTSIAALLIITASFENILTYIGFTLSLFTTLSVAGIFVARAKDDPKVLEYKTPLYPYVPVFFVLVEASMMFYLFYEKPEESFYGMLTVASGLIIYTFVKTKNKEELKNETV